MTRRTLLVAFVVVTLVLMFFGSNTIASGMTSGGMMGGAVMEDVTSRIVPDILVVGVAVMLGWTLFGRRHQTTPTPASRRRCRIWHHVSVKRLSRSSLQLAAEPPRAAADAATGL